MSFFEESYENVRAAFGIAGKKTEKAVEISKKKIEEKKLEGKLQKSFSELGKICYGEIKNSGKARDIKQNLISSIDFQMSELAKVREELKILKYGGVCPKCGAGIQKDMEFCGKCGANVKQSL